MIRTCIDWAQRYDSRKHLIEKQDASQQNHLSYIKLVFNKDLEKIYQDELKKIKTKTDQKITKWIEEEDE